jgi:hypothetical protein
MDPISANFAFPASFSTSQAARAYGVRPSPAVQARAAASGVEPAQRTEPLARIGQPAQPRPASDPARLVAAQVDPIDLARDVAQVQGRPTDGALPMYRHPADRNQAATAVALGRSLDIKG